MMDKTPTSEQVAILKSNRWYKYNTVPVGYTCFHCHREIIAAAGWLHPNGAKYLHNSCVLKVKSIQALLNPQSRLFE